MLHPEFMKLVKDLANVDLAKTANYKTARAIADHPKTNYPNATEVAFSIKIDVNQDFVNDEDFPKVVDAYVETLNKIYEQLAADYPYFANSIFLKIAATMTLSYSFN